MYRALKLIALLTALLVVTVPASAALQLRILTNGTPAVEVTDEGPGDLIPIPGVVQYSGSVGPEWLVNVTTGTSKPEVGDAAFPTIDLNSVNLSSTTGGSVTVELTDTDFTGTGPAFVAFGGVTAGTVLLKTYVDGANTPFGKSTPVTTQGPFFNNAFANNIVTAVSPTAPYSITFELLVTHAASGSTGIDAEFHVNPQSLNCPSNVIVRCGGSLDPNVNPSLGKPSYTRTNCTPLNLSYSDTIVTNGPCSKTLTRIWTIVDACEATNYCTQIITVIEDTLPILTVPANVTVQCSNSVPAVGNATATDNCDTDVNVVYLGQTRIEGQGCAYSLVRTWKATDSCGNAVTNSQTIVVRDTTPPVLTVPPNVTIECSASLPPGNPTATDNCGTAIITFLSQTTNGSGCTFTIKRKWKAADPCGNAVTNTQTITVKDTTPPVITFVPNGGELGCVPAPTAASIQAQVTATDNCRPVTINVTFTDGGTACESNRTFRITATDGCNTSAVRTVTYTMTCAPCVPGTFNFEGNSALDGPDGNIRQFTANGVSVRVSAFSRVKVGGAWSTAYLGQYGGGLGVTDSSEGTGANNSHTVDNLDRNNYVLFEFSQPVVINRAFLGYVVTDSDLSLWVGNFADPYNNHLTLSDGVLGSFGFTEENFTTDTTPRWADLNAGEIVGNAIVIAALASDESPEDQFKIALLDFCKRICQPLSLTCVSATTGQVGAPYASFLIASGGNAPYKFSIVSGSLPPGLTLNTNTGAITGTPTTAGSFNFIAKVTDALGATATTGGGGCTITISCVDVCVSSTFNFEGNTATDGADGNIRTYTVDGISVKASAFSRIKSSGAWSPAYLGAYGGGLGVTDSSEGTGGNNSHTVDNIDRDNYILFEFSQPVVLNRAFLGYTVTDSDLSVRIGTFADPFNNHLNLSDAVLGSFGFSEDNLTDLSTTRWADLNAGEVVGNAIVIAAWVGDDTPDDQFKIELLDVCKRTCPAPCVASICGSVLRDCDANGSVSGEAGLAGWTVTLKNSAGTTTLGTTTTDANGRYCFSDLAGGSYKVVVTPKPNYQQTFSFDTLKDNIASINLANCQNKTGVNFGYTGTSPDVHMVLKGPATAKCGDTITYTFAITNTGNTCLYGGMRVNDPLLGGEVFAQTPVNPGEGFVFTKTYVVKTSDAGTLINTATIIGDPPGGLANVSKSVSVSTTVTCASPCPPPPCLVTKPGCNIVNLSWCRSSGATSYTVKRSLYRDGPYTTIRTGVTTTNCTDTGLNNGVCYYYKVCAVNSSGAGADCDAVSGIPCNVAPSPWAARDIGSPGDTGGASYDGAIATIVGAGADIWDTSDEFQYAYMPASGNCGIVARVNSVQNTDPWAKAGVMIRESLNANSRHAFMCLTPGNGAAFQSRSTTGGASANVNNTSITAPYWVAVTRVGNVFTGYISSNGSTWTKVGEQTIYMSTSVYIGLGVTSHNDGVLCTAKFQNITASP